MIEEIGAIPCPRRAYRESGLRAAVARFLEMEPSRVEICSVENIFLAAGLEPAFSGRARHPHDCRCSTYFEAQVRERQEAIDHAFGSALRRSLPKDLHGLAFTHYSNRPLPENREP